MLLDKENTGQRSGVNYPVKFKRKPDPNIGKFQPISISKDKTVTLDGSKSKDEDDLYYRWTLVTPKPNPVDISNWSDVISDVDISTFEKYGTGTYGVELEVSDGTDVGTATAAIKVIP